MGTRAFISNCPNYRSRTRDRPSDEVKFVTTPRKLNVVFDESVHVSEMKMDSIVLMQLVIDPISWVACIDLVGGIDVNLFISRRPLNVELEPSVGCRLQSSNRTLSAPYVVFTRGDSSTDSPLV